MKITSNASRFVNKSLILFHYKLFKIPLFNRSLFKAGRNNVGRIVCLTKMNLKKKTIIPTLNFNFRNKQLSFLLNIRFSYKYIKTFSMVYTLGGGFTFLQTNNLTKLFNFIYFKNKNQKILFLLNMPVYTLLYFLKNTQKISCLEILPGKGVQYARSSGVFAILIKINMHNHTVLIQLPSGVRKFFSIYASVMLDRVSFKYKNLIKNTKSGFWRNLGIKPKVRGIAKNPVDHPHGGRTKSIKYPRTPWGKTTKYK